MNKIFNYIKGKINYYRILVQIKILNSRWRRWGKELSKMPKEKKIKEINLMREILKPYEKHHFIADYKRALDILEEMANKNG